LAGLALGMWVALSGVVGWYVLLQTSETVAARAVPITTPKPTVTDELKQLASRLPADTSAATFTIPILYYHNTPSDFDQQLVHLEQKGYQVISLDAAILGLAGGPLPSKPVVITFDDGFADQMQAFEILKAHKAPATFYIINGSPASAWCVGASRRYNDPLQPPEGCGDAYLTWDQVKQLDRSGLIDIGGHTLDHANLPSLPPEQQSEEIAASKAGIEAQLGHAIHHFAYPYGAYDANAMEAVSRAGYTTAVTTQEGVGQSYSGRYEMARLRAAYLLP
jgi:peptidoglycan/xylan/chitin deacetylase (PgdA/CDA1 family)